MNERLIPMTDHRGTVLVVPDDLVEPEPGSIVLTNGVHGTAWQRHFTTGKWHSTTGRASTWSELLAQRNVVLVYDAPVRRRGDC